MTTYIISRDNKEITRFTDQENDFCILRYFMTKYSNSMHYAFKYDGYKVEYFNQDEPKKLFNYNQY